MQPDPLWEDFLNSGSKFNAQATRFLELRYVLNGDIETDTGFLPANAAAKWLDEGRPGLSGSSIVGSSRIIVYPKTSSRDGFPDLPFSSTDVRLLTRDIGLPTRFFSSHVKLRRIAAHFKTKSGHSWVFRSYLFSVVTMHRTRDNTNLSIIITDDARENTGVDRLIEACIASKEHALHPFLPMLVTVDHAVEELRKDCSKAMNHSAKIHFSLGLPTDHLGPQSAFRVSRQVRNSIERQRDLAADRELLTQLCGTLTSLHNSLQDVRSQHQDFVKFINSPTQASDQANRLALSNESLESTIEYLVSTSRDMLNRAQQIEQRLQWLFPMLQLEQAKRDTQVSIQLAKLTQRDSSSMMAIAFVTTLFLPGTFVATLLSTPGYNNWDPEQGWKYWAVTVPLTLVVMTVIMSWIWKLHLGHLRKDGEIQQELAKDFDEKDISV